MTNKTRVDLSSGLNKTFNEDVETKMIAHNVFRLLYDDLK